MGAWLTVARFWSPVFAAIAAIASGASGTGRVVPAGQFRSDLYAVEPGSPEYPEINLDRTMQVIPREGGYVNGPIESPFSGNNRRVAIVDLVVSYRYDLDLAEVPADDGQSTTTAARARAADDIEVILRALTWPANYSTLSNGFDLVSIVPDGRWRLDDRGNGQLLLTQPLTVEIAANPATSVDLG